MPGHDIYGDAYTSGSDSLLGAFGGVRRTGPALTFRAGARPIKGLPSQYRPPASGAGAPLTPPPVSASASGIPSANTMTADEAFAAGLLAAESDDLPPPRRKGPGLLVAIGALTVIGLVVVGGVVVFKGAKRKAK